MTKKSILWVLALLLISAGIIFYKFNQIPHDLTYDEVDFARLALSLNHSSYTPYSPLATGHSTTYFYLILASFKLFGVSSFSLRLPSAIFGVLSPVLIYLIFAKIFTKKAFIVFLISVLFVSQRWYFHFAKFSFEATFLIFLELMSVYFLLRTRSYASLILGGVFAGLAYNSYLAGRIFFLLPIAMICYDVYRKKAHWKSLFYFLIPFILMILPLNIYLLQHQDIRIQQLSYMNNAELTFGKKMAFLGENMVKFPLMLFMPGKGDVWGVHNYPLKSALNPIMNVLLASGIVISLIKYRTKYTALFIAWAILSIIPTLLTYPWENPNMLRTITILPAIVYFCCITFVSVGSLMSHRIPRYTAMIMIAFIVALSAGYELRTYYHYQATVINDAFNLRQDIYGIKDEGMKKLYFKLIHR